MIGEKERNRLLMSGAIAGVLTPFILKYLVMPVLSVLGNFLPALSVKLGNPGTIEVNIRQSLTGVQAGLARWLTDALGLTIPETSFMPYVWAAAGGALLFLVGAYIADALKWLKGNARQKTTVIIFAGSAIAGFIIGGFAVPDIGLTLVNTFIALGVNAAILAWVFTLIDPQGKIGLTPF